GVNPDTLPLTDALNNAIGFGGGNVQGKVRVGYNNGTPGGSGHNVQSFLQTNFKDTVYTTNTGAPSGTATGDFKNGLNKLTNSDAFSSVRSRVDKQIEWLKSKAVIANTANNAARPPGATWNFASGYINVSDSWIEMDPIRETDAAKKNEPKNSYLPGMPVVRVTTYAKVPKSGGGFGSGPGVCVEVIGKYSGAQKMTRKCYSMSTDNSADTDIDRLQEGVLFVNGGNVQVVNTAQTVTGAGGPGGAGIFNGNLTIVASDRIDGFDPTNVSSGATVFGRPTASAGNSRGFHSGAPDDTYIPRDVNADGVPDDGATSTNYTGFAPPKGWVDRNGNGKYDYSYYDPVSGQNVKEDNYAPMEGNVAFIGDLKYAYDQKYANNGSDTNKISNYSTYKSDGNNSLGIVASNYFSASSEVKNNSTSSAEVVKAAGSDVSSWGGGNLIQGVTVNKGLPQALAAGAKNSLDIDALLFSFNRSLQFDTWDSGYIGPPPPPPAGIKALPPLPDPDNSALHSPGWFQLTHDVSNAALIGSTDPGHTVNYKGSINSKYGDAEGNWEDSNSNNVVDPNEYVMGYQGNQNFTYDQNLRTTLPPHVPQISKANASSGAVLEFVIISIVDMGSIKERKKV
ncbi:MAG: hypothetical protein HYU64_03655, partial [Armatimonadetes bacterium]|nr:hypothetical protein [Armatimonadota bacterium]